MVHAIMAIPSRLDPSSAIASRSRARSDTKALLGEPDGTRTRFLFQWTTSLYAAVMMPIKVCPSYGPQQKYGACKQVMAIKQRSLVVQNMVHLVISPSY